MSTLWLVRHWFRFEKGEKNERVGLGVFEKYGRVKIGSF
jgi:hypothetical protein